jgi:hypothetical protein
MKGLVALALLSAAVIFSDEMWFRAVLGAGIVMYGLYEYLDRRFDRLERRLDGISARRDR